MTSTAQSQHRSSTIATDGSERRNSGQSQVPKIRSSAILSNSSVLHQDRQAVVDDQSNEIAHLHSTEHPGEALADFQPPITNPYFTLIEDTTTGEHYHPSVHYIFEDDEPDLLLAASARALGGNEDYRSPSMDKSEREEYESALLPVPPLGSEERYIIMNMASDGYTVDSAHSLSSNWQISDVKVGEAPTWDEDTSDTQGKGLMLGIRGSDLPMQTDTDDNDGVTLLQNALTPDEVPLMIAIEHLAADFGKGQTIINSVIGAKRETQSIAHGVDHSRVGLK